MLLRLLAALVLVLTPAAASADQPSGSKAQARASFVKGQTLYRQGKFAQALAAFREATRQTKHPSITINMAQCHRNLGRAKEAIFFYRLYISQWRRTYPGRPVPHEGEVKEHIIKLEAAIKQKAATRPPTVKPGLIMVSGALAERAQVLVDDAPRGVWPMTRPISVQPGLREVRVLAEGYFPWRETVQIRAGEKREVKVDLKRIPEPRRSRVWLVAWISTLALAGGMEALGIAYQVEANGQFSQTPDHLTARNISIAGHVTAGVLAAAAVTSFVLWLNSGKVEAPPGASGALVPTSGGAAMVWTVRF